MAQRHEPEIYHDNYDLPVKRWRAWGICTSTGMLAEVTLDHDKAQVWISGGHKVIELIHDEPIEAEAPDHEPKLL